MDIVEKENQIQTENQKEINNHGMEEEITQQKIYSPQQENDSKQKNIDTQSTVTQSIGNQLNQSMTSEQSLVFQAPQEIKRFNSSHETQSNATETQDFTKFNESLIKPQIESKMSQETEYIEDAKQKKNDNQYYQLGSDQFFTKNDIKLCFSDKQIFNQANIFTRKRVDDLFDDSDEEVQEEGLVTQIHKRNMQDVYDMTPMDKKFTFLWNEFFIKMEKIKIKQKVPIKRSDIYGFLQIFIKDHCEDLLILYNQFVIHLFTLQDNGIVDSEQIQTCLRYLKDSRNNSSFKNN